MMITAWTVPATPFSVSASASDSATAFILRLTWYITLVALFYPTCAASASINAVRRAGSNNDGVFPADFAPSLTLSSLINTQLALSKRSATEHVILCDCLTFSGIRSSQMAFYSAEVQGLPTGGVAIVDTDFNTTATWYNATTSATWMDTGVPFKAVIGYHVAEDDYVGKGNNGYGDFRCWQRAKTGFAYYLKRDGNVCEMRIDCNKAAAPSTDSAYVPLESITDDGQAAGSPATGSSPATSSSSSSSSSSNPGGNAPQPGLNNKDKTTISTGAVIGIAIGIVGAFTFLAGGAGFFFARRRRRIRKQREQQQQGKGAMTESTITEAYASGSDLVKSDSNAVHEMDGGWCRHEMGDDTGHYEIDGQVRCEMDGEEGEIKEKMDDSFGEAGVKEVIILNEKGDAKKAILDEKKGQVRVSEKEKEVRRDKEERERERQQQQQQQQQEQKQQLEEEQKKNRDSDDERVSPISLLSPAWTEEAGQMPFCLPAIMPEPEKLMAAEFRAHKEKVKKDEANIKYRFEEETHKYMKGEVTSAGGKDPADNSSSGQEEKKKEEEEEEEEDGLP